MVAAGVILLSVLGLVILYMRQPNFRTIRLSAANFVDDFSKAQSARKRWKWTAPLSSKWFWLRAAILGLLLAAVMVDELLLPAHKDARLGLRLVIDTSYSMSTDFEDGTRFDAALAVAEAVLKQVTSYQAEVQVCVAGVEVNSRIIELGPLELGDRKLQALAPRLSGGGATLLRKAAIESSDTCAVTHVVVISDLPAPLISAGPGSDQSQPIIWLSIGGPADNVGIVDVYALQAPLSGRVDRVGFDIRTYGKTSTTVDVKVYGPQGQLVDTDLDPGTRDYIHSVTFVPLASGDYTVTLNPGGSYVGDDRLLISVERVGDLQVDWRLSDPPMPQIPTWQPATDKADFRVGPLSTMEGPDAPHRFVAVAGRYRDATDQRIGLFVEDSPILRGVNLDVLERFAPTGLANQMDGLEGYVPVVTGLDGAVWIAMRREPRSVIVPSPVSTTNGALENLSLLIFFNAIDWVLQDNVASLQTRLQTRNGQDIFRGFSEGDTTLEPRADGRIDALVPVSASAQSDPLWPWLVVAALLLLVVERLTGVQWKSVAA